MKLSALGVNAIAEIGSYSLVRLNRTAEQRVKATTNSVAQLSITQLIITQSTERLSRGARRMATTCIVALSVVIAVLPVA